MALRDYARYFRTDDAASSESARFEAHEALAWMSHAYHARFLAWLDSQASRPISITSNQLSVVESAVRANTLREVRAYLTRLRAQAEATVGESND